MNESNPPRPLPPHLTSAIPPMPTRPSPPPQPGDDPAERVAIPNALGAIEAILRQPRRVIYQLRQPGSGWLIAGMILVGMLCALVYGVVAGTFSGGRQLWAAPVKISAGLLLSGMICLPSLYIFTCLSGAESRLSEVFGLLGGLLMLTAILLVGFAPVAWIFSQSTESVAWMGILHLVFWFISACFGLRFLHAGFAHSKARSNAGFNTWVAIYILVAVQMTTALRPIVGTAETFLPTEKKFFLSHWGEWLRGDGEVWRGDFR